MNWIDVKIGLPTNGMLVWVTGPSGYVRYPRFHTTAYLDRKFRPWGNGEEPRWLDVTNDPLSDKGWIPDHWSMLINNSEPGELTLDAYQNAARAHAVYPDQGSYPGGLVYTALALAGESGELANLVKKILRGDKIDIDEHVKKMKSEAGDCLWYVSQIAKELDVTLGELGYENLEKLAERRKLAESFQKKET